ncbi:hypothetical protein VP01_553g1 [Puccinia sorghi]|uniref:Integrase catalytic domain-containing protein n=1 Tax=Puccinia sorghi TaxID=27349 RepID=A0A0L6UJA6_9BASI|nr:hypothetical protein VP01_553g1 [Puccinia sorghi]
MCDPASPQCHLSEAEILHKSLGHVSYSRIRQKLGIPLKFTETCKACTVSKMTKASYKHRSSRASKPFEELHLDLIGPISPVSHKNHKYILTIVDGNTRFCSAIPIKTKSDVFSALTYVIDAEAKRIGYYPSIIHSDRGTEFINASLGDYCRANIPAHRSKKSPYEMFKGHSIALDFFRPIGNPVVVYSHQKKEKLDPRGAFGKLIGFDVELKSYKVLMNDGHLVDSKNVEFLDFESSCDGENADDELFIEEQVEQPFPRKFVERRSEESINVKEEEPEDSFEDTRSEDRSEDYDSGVTDLEIVEALVPVESNPVGRILRERTLQVKPVKYSAFTEDPRSFKKAVTARCLGRSMGRN